MGSFEQLLFVGAFLVILSVVASKASTRLGIPALLFFLGIGIAAGTHGWGGIAFTNYSFAQELGIVALVFILFLGGINTQLKEVRPVLKQSLVLSTIGVLIATALVGIFAHMWMDFSWLEGLLLGATIVSTDVAAAFTVLRSKNVSLKEGIVPLLELEAALNDPMAVFLGVILLGLFGQKEHSLPLLLLVFVQQTVVGVLIGWGSGKLIAWVVNKIKLENEGLYPVLTSACVLLTYSITQGLGGSGFLAAYIAGIILGNSNLLHKRNLCHFHEGTAWLGQIAMFLAMGLLVNPSELLRIAPLGIALSAFLIFVARPLSVFLSIPTNRFGKREKLMISWAGLRGAVPIILASYVLAANIPRATDIFNLVFFVTFFSVLFQGTTIPAVAKFLRVDLPFREKTSFPIEFNPTKNLKSKLFEIGISAKSQAVGKSLIELNLPQDALIVLIQRAGETFVPRGGTQVQAHDVLLTICESKNSEEIKKILS